MTILCDAPDPSLGVAVRLSDYIDCQARALGENGFQAFAGSPLATGLLSALVTIFVALIGYRLILGITPGPRDGVSWALRLGLTLALVTSWPAFQTLIFNVVVDGPREIAAIVAPAAGLYHLDEAARIQVSYDIIRSGLAGAAEAASEAPLPQGDTAAAAGNAGYFQTPQPWTASLFVLSTLGGSAALKIAIGFLLAIAPIAMLGLLFDATIGVFIGWLRVLAGAVLALVAATLVIAIELVLIEGELVRLQALGGNGASFLALDRQGLFTIVSVFVPVMLVAIWAALKLPSALGWSPRPWAIGAREPSIAPTRRTGTHAGSNSAISSRTAITGERTRAASVSDALATTIRREQDGRGEASAGPSRGTLVAQSLATSPSMARAPLGVAGRRTVRRASRTAARRDRLS